MKNAARDFLSGILTIRKLFFRLGLFGCLFTCLVSNTAAGFASRLTGSLAFAATAVFSAFAKVTSFKGNDSFHLNCLQLKYKKYLYYIIIPQNICQVVENIF